MPEFTWLRPLWLLLLPLLGLGLFVLARRLARAGAWQSLCDAHLLAVLAESPGAGASARRRVPQLAWWLAGTGLALAIVALAGPSWERQPVAVFRSADARVIVLDLSRSMDAADLAPSRLARARFKVADILERSREGQSGLVVFAGDAFVVAPLTRDAATLRALLPALDSNVLPVQGSRPDLGLAMAARLLEQGGASSGEVLLIGDDAGGAEARDAARALADAGFRVHTLAVGTEAGAPVPLAEGGFVTRGDGGIVIARLDAGALASLASAGGGRSARLSADASDLDHLLGRAPRPAGDGVVAGDERSVVWRDGGIWLLPLLLLAAPLAFRRGWLT